jgi:ABC-type glycerol-3-phosphate transport system substrate-binding protein
MKRFNSFFIAIAAAALLAGCGGKSGSGPQATNSVSTATNGFGGYVKSLGEAQKSADKTIDVTSINQEIQLFNVQEGRNPKNLQELVPNYMAKIPDAPHGYKIIYDATNGTVKVIQQP